MAALTTPYPSYLLEFGGYSVRLVLAHSSRRNAVVPQSSDPNNPSIESLTEILESVTHIAVVGMSRDPAKAARRVPSYLAARGFDITPINPFAAKILGRPTYPDLASVDRTIDLVLVFRPSAEAGAVVEAAMARPERPIIWLQEGIRNDPAAEKARKAGYTVIQDLCIYKVHRSIERKTRPGVL